MADTFCKFWFMKVNYSFCFADFLKIGSLVFSGIVHDNS